MHRNKLILLCCALALVAGSTTTLQAQLSSEEVARLGADLTPLGAEKAGNADGTIPAWEGGITTPPAGYKPGMHHPDPFASDAVKFTITADNMAEYADKLTAGYKALLETYPSFKMNVYPTHRSASYPQRIYDMTKEIAGTARLIENGHGVEGAINGIPFPIPKEGVEVIWNHLLRFRGEIASRTIAQATPTRGGKYTLVQFSDEFYLIYSIEGMTEADLNNKILFFQQEVTAPARLAGGILLVHETLNQVKEHRSAWLYNPGQRRVRRAPNVAYDNPGTASDGMRTSDQFDMFNGAVDRYNWELVGKKEMYVPLRAASGLGGGCDAQGGCTAYLQAAYLLRGRGQLADRGHGPVRQSGPAVAGLRRSRHQLLRPADAVDHARGAHRPAGGRYLAIGMDNENPMYIFGIDRTLEDYTPAALRRSGVR